MYEPDDLTETRMELLAAVSTDSDLYLAKMPGNCRNISDEVFPGIHVGDKGAAKNTFYLKKVRMVIRVVDHEKRPLPPRLG